MFVDVLKLFIYLLFSFNVPFIKMQNPESPTTLKTIIIETTTEDITIITDIPQSDVELAMKHDYGRYTTMIFNYINSQYDKLQQEDRCFDDYTKCLITQSVMSPVCVVNNPGNRPWGFATYNSYCDAYFDNCLRKMRFWRTLDIGVCNFTKGGYFDILPSRKRLGYRPRKKYFLN